MHVGTRMRVTGNRTPPQTGGCTNSAERSKIASMHRESVKAKCQAAGCKKPEMPTITKMVLLGLRHSPSSTRAVLSKVQSKETATQAHSPSNARGRTRVLT